MDFIEVICSSYLRNCSGGLFQNITESLNVKKLFFLNGFVLLGKFFVGRHFKSNLFHRLNLLQTLCSVISCTYKKWRFVLRSGINLEKKFNILFNTYLFPIFWTLYNLYLSTLSGNTIFVWNAFLYVIISDRDREKER